MIKIKKEHRKRKSVGTRNEQIAININIYLNKKLILYTIIYNLAKCFVCIKNGCIHKECYMRSF